MEEWDQETLEKAIARESGGGGAAPAGSARGGASLPHTLRMPAPAPAIRCRCLVVPPLTASASLPACLPPFPCVCPRPPPHSCAATEKHAADNRNQPTAIICKFFLDAVERKLYGWFWQVGEGGDGDGGGGGDGQGRQRARVVAARVLEAPEQGPKP